MVQDLESQLMGECNREIIEKFALGEQENFPDMDVGQLLHSFWTDISQRIRYPINEIRIEKGSTVLKDRFIFDYMTRGGFGLQSSISIGDLQSYAYERNGLASRFKKKRYPKIGLLESLWGTKSFNQRVVTGYHPLYGECIEIFSDERSYQRRRLIEIIRPHSDDMLLTNTEKKMVAYASRLVECANRIENGEVESPMNGAKPYSADNLYQKAEDMRKLILKARILGVRIEHYDFIQWGLFDQEVIRQSNNAARKATTT